MYIEFNQLNEPVQCDMMVCSCIWKFCVNFGAVLLRLVL